MYWWICLCAFNIFIISFVLFFKGRKHPYTILAYSGAMSFSIVVFELISLFQIESKSLLPNITSLIMALLISWLSYYLVSNIEKISVKFIIINSLVPLAFVLVYTFGLNIKFLFPMFFMTLMIPLLTPKHIKHQRKSLFLDN